MKLPNNIDGWVKFLANCNATEVDSPAGPSGWQGTAPSPFMGFRGKANGGKAIGGPRRHD